MPTAASNTAYGIINDAMQDAGLLQDGDMPNSFQLATYLRKLCDLINLWQTQGLKLFLLQNITVPLVEDQSLYTIGPGQDVDMAKPTQVLQGYVLTASNNVRRPLVALSWNEWMQLSQVTGNSGMVSSYFVDKQPTLLKVHFWNPPDADEAANTAHLLVRTQATVLESLEEDVVFPQEWRIALRWGLADDICTGQPATIMQRCAAKAEQFRLMLEDYDVEDTATFFVPDQQSQQNTGRFS